MNKATILGIDVGGTGVKGAIVDIHKGELITPRFRLDTPQPATPQAISESVNAIKDHFNYSGPIGCGFPSVIQQGIVRTATNIDKAWIGVNIVSIFGKATNCPVSVINDADAAAKAEIQFGAGQSQKGITMMITIGTGIGTAIFTDGALVPNTELGHIIMPGHTAIAERYTSKMARKREDLSWEVWGKRFNEYLNYLYPLFYPDLIILGGGTSKRFELFEEYLQVPTRVVPAELKNEAGIVGAALAAPR